MFCEHCGHRLLDAQKFCTRCGQPAAKTKSPHLSEEMWWYRLLKVFYVVSYLPLLLIVPIVWSLNSSSYDYYTKISTDTTDQALWYSLVTIAIYVSVLRLIKVAVLYVATGSKPEWRKECRRIF